MKDKNPKGTMRKCSVLVGMWLMLVSAFATPGSKTTMLEGYRVRVVRGGETVETPGTGGTAGTINNREMTGGDYEEAIPAILLEDGATIRVTSGTAIWAMIVMTNGSATIETASGTSLSFNRSLLLRGGAKMTVKGDLLNAVKVGNSDWAPYYELDGLMLKKGAMDITDRIYCSSIARIVSMPKDWVENHVPDESLDTGTVYLLDDIYKGMTAVNDCWLGKNIYFRFPDFINGREVTVDHAVTLHLEPFEITVPRITLADHLKAVNAYGTQVSFNLPGTNYCFNANLADLNAVLSLDFDATESQQEGSAFAGVVTGYGTVRAAFGAGAKPTASKTVTASGDWGDFAGAVVAECSNADVTDAPVGTFVVSNSLPNVAVHVGNNAQVFLAPNATDVAAKEVSGTTVTGSYGTSAGKTLTVGTLSGRIRVSGEGEVLCTSIAPGTTLANDRMVTYPDAVRAKALKDSNTCVAAQFAGADGIVDVGALVSALSGTTVKYQAIGATDGTRLANVPEGVVLETDAKILVESATSGVGLHGDGTLAFGRAGQADWTNSVDFWFDFSRTETFRKVSYAADSPDPAKLNMTYSYDGKSCPVFERCVDWRFPEREGTLWNGLYYAAPGNANANYYPIAATNTYQHVPDMTYMTFGDKTSGRMPFGFSKNTANDGELTDVNYVVMVFSSRLGGGEALVADEQSYFQRERKASAEDPIHPFVKAALPDGLSIRADGRTMENPEKICPNGDWQIVTIKMKGRDKDDKIVGSKFRGIGFRGKTKTQGCGQSEYGEVMLFTNDVPLLTVLLAERHLARKWNIASYNEADLNAAVAAEIAATTNLVSGVGSSGARIEAPGFATVRVTGDFAGEISLDGGSLIVDGTLPWTEAQVAAVGNRCFWLDGDDASSVKTFGDYKTSAMSDIQKTKIRIIKNKTDADYNSGPLMWGADSREPYRRYEAHRFGPVRGWIDFFEWADDTAGNTLRMVPTSEDPNPDNIQNVAYNMSVQTIVMAHDSTWGGGNPVYDSTLNDGHFGLRLTTDPRSQVWKKGSRGLDCTEFRDGLNRIDGVTQANSNGFGGQAEVYAVRGTGAIETRYFVDSYQNSEPSRTTQRQASCVGEILYYSTALDDATISGIESYLMNKWLGILPSGYGDVRRATVKGDGTVEVADLSRMPNIASDFTGTVRVAGTSGELTMTVDADARQVNGALVNADALFELPASATIHVKFANSSARKTPYRYRLIDAAGTENTIWTVDLSDPSVPRGAVIVREGNKVFLDVTTLGLLLIVK